MADKMLAYVKANDGKRLDEIAKALGTDTASLTRPSQMLLESKAVKRSGQRRGTKYHLGSGAKRSGPAKKATSVKGREKKVVRKTRTAKATKPTMTAGPGPSAAQAIGSSSGR